MDGGTPDVLGIIKQLFARSSPTPAATGDVRLAKESRYVVAIDDQEVVCRHPDDRVDRVRWEDLDAVIVETNDTGPWGIDILWVLLSHQSQRGCIVPHGATGEKQLLDALQRLPGFDNEQLLASLSCTDNRSFVCWRRANPGPRRDEEMV